MKSKFAISKFKPQGSLEDFFQQFGLVSDTLIKGLRDKFEDDDEVVKKELLLLRSHFMLLTQPFKMQSTFQLVPEMLFSSYSNDNFVVVVVFSL